MSPLWKAGIIVKHAWSILTLEEAWLTVIWLSNYQSYSIPHLHTLQTFAELDECNNSVKLAIKPSIWPTNRPYPHCGICSCLHGQAWRHNWGSHDGWLKCVSDRVPSVITKTVDGVLTVGEVLLGQDGHHGHGHCHCSCHELFSYHCKEGNFREDLVSAVFLFS